jgi:Uma2 family endonuclease
MSTATQLLTADDLWKMPDHGSRYELVKGELRAMSPAGSSHGAFSMNLAAPLHQFVRARKLGIVVAAETGFIIATEPDTVLAPDAAFIRQERVMATGITQKYWPGPPDLAIETMSPGDAARDVEKKAREWLTAGTEQVWVINPQLKTVTVYRLSGKPETLGDADILHGGDMVPGFQLPVAEIFAI